MDVGSTFDQSDFYDSPTRASASLDICKVPISDCYVRREEWIKKKVEPIGTYTDTRKKVRENKFVYSSFILLQCLMVLQSVGTTR